MPCANVKECLCDNVSCQYHGFCCECVKHHREKGHATRCIELAMGKTSPISQGLLDRLSKIPLDTVMQFVLTYEGEEKK